MKRVILETANHSLILEEEGDTLEISDHFYPLPGYSNGVTTSIVLKKDHVEVYETRYSWSGTGTKKILFFPLPEDEIEKLKKVARDISSLEDFRNLFEELERIEDSLDKEVEMVIDSIVDDVLASIEVSSRIVHLTEEEKHQLKEQVRDYVIDLLTT